MSLLLFSELANLEKGLISAVSPQNDLNPELMPGRVAWAERVSEVGKPLRCSSIGCLLAKSFHLGEDCTLERLVVDRVVGDRLFADEEGKTWVKTSVQISFIGVSLCRLLHKP